MPRRRDWRRERLLLLLLLLAIAPVVWAMLVAVAVAAIIPDRLPSERTPPPALPPPLIEVDLTLSVTDNRVDATVTFTEPDAGGAHDANVNWGDGTPETKLFAETSPLEVCHLYDASGEYTVVATVAGSRGLGTSAQVAVVVGEPNPYRIPDEGDECSGSSALGAR